MIIPYLARDLRSLKACSLTCRSLSIAAAPHLHHTLTLTENRPEFNRSRLEPLSRLHKLDIMSLVREIRVKQGGGTNSWFVPGAFSSLNLRYFYAFARVHTLKIQNMRVYRFLPAVKRYFPPTIRSIALYDPCCTPRQLSYFLSRFPNLDNVDIERIVACVPDTTVPVTELAPPSAPTLRGRLSLSEFPLVDTWTRFTTLCGGLRFRHMDLVKSANCVPTLLEACAETLESIRFHVEDGTLSE